MGNTAFPTPTRSQTPSHSSSTQPAKASTTKPAKSSPQAKQCRSPTSHSLYLHISPFAPALSRASTRFPQTTRFPALASASACHFRAQNNSFPLPPSPSSQTCLSERCATLPALGNCRSSRVAGGRGCSLNGRGNRRSGWRRRCRSCCRLSFCLIGLIDG